MSWLDQIYSLFGTKPGTIATPDPTQGQVAADPGGWAPPLVYADLVAAGITEPRVTKFLSQLNEAMHEFEITTAQRAAMFLAQVTWESEDFKYMAEIWGPTAAQLGYENRHDLGNDLPGAGGPGNGRRWAGHGLLEVTGYFNHNAEATYFGIPIGQVAAWLQTPIGACRSAAHFWFVHGCNALADAGNFSAVTKKINGGYTALDKRLVVYQAIAQAKGIA